VFLEYLTAEISCEIPLEPWYPGPYPLKMDLIDLRGGIVFFVFFPAIPLEPVWAVCLVRSLTRECQGVISFKFRRIIVFSFHGDWRSNSIPSLKLKLAPQTVPQDFPGALLCIPARKPPVPARKGSNSTWCQPWNLLRLIVVVCLPGFSLASKKRKWKQVGISHTANRPAGMACMLIKPNKTALCHDSI
jgi:hypothetical protein